jgi:hypothetical protein
MGICVARIAPRSCEMATVTPPSLLSERLEAITFKSSNNPKDQKYEMESILSEVLYVILFPFTIDCEGRNRRNTVTHVLRSIVERTPSRLVDNLAKWDWLQQSDGMVDDARI